jgi:hypothetical protein
LLELTKGEKMNFTFDFDFEDIFTNDNEGNTSIWETFSDNIHNVHDTLYDLYETFMKSTEMKFEPNSNSWWNLAVIIMIVEIVIGFFGNGLSLIVWNRGKECCKMACSTLQNTSVKRFTYTHKFPDRNGHSTFL